MSLSEEKLGKRSRIEVPPSKPSMSAIQANKGIDNPLVSCNECHTIWHAVKCERCPLCGQNVGVHWKSTEEQTNWLLYAVSLLDEERIQRGAECSAWEFGQILREHVPSYNEMCRGTIQICYEVLLKQPPSLKVAFAMEFFKDAYLQAPEDPMMYKQEDEEDHHYDSDVDEWW
jgi:hypothetical protein